MFSMFNIFSSSNDKITPLMSTKESSPMSPDTVLVRPNRHIPDHLDSKNKEESKIDDGRVLLYETKLVVSPVLVSKRESSSDKALNSKRLLVTKDEVNDLSKLLKDMVIEGQSKKSNKAETEKAEPKTSPNSEGGEKQYGRYTEKIQLPSSPEPVEVVRSRRLSA